MGEYTGMGRYLGERGQPSEITPAYERMLTHARECLQKRAPLEVAAAAGVVYDGTAAEFRFASMGEEVRVSFPSCEAAFVQSGARPEWAWHLVMLHYLDMADGAELSDEFIPFRMLPGGLTRGQSFDRDCARVLVSELCGKPMENVARVCEALGGVLRKTNADLCAEFLFMPRFPVTMQLWFADDELPGSGQLLLNANATRYLSTEDAVVVGSIVAESLAALYHRMFNESQASENTEKEDM